MKPEIAKQLENNNYKGPKWKYRILTVGVFIFLFVFISNIAYDIGRPLITLSLLFGLLNILIIAILYRTQKHIFRFPHRFFGFFLLIFLFFILYGHWGYKLNEGLLNEIYETEEFKNIYKQVFAEFLLENLDSEEYDLVMNVYSDIANNIEPSDSIMTLYTKIINSKKGITSLCSDSLLTTAEHRHGAAYSRASSKYNYLFMWYSSIMPVILLGLAYCIYLIKFHFKKFKIIKAERKSNNATI